MHVIHLGENRYPVALMDRMGEEAPRQLTALGNSDLVRLPMIALFCSAKCPGSAILAAYDQAASWRDSGRCVISGFHSPIEKECLRIDPGADPDHLLRIGMSVVPTVLVK